MKSKITETVYQMFTNPQFDVNALRRELGISDTHLRVMCINHFAMSPRELMGTVLRIHEVYFF